MHRSPQEEFRRCPSRIYCFADSVELCRTLLSAGARVIQLRHKSATDAQFRRLAAAMLADVRQAAGALLIVNDRLEIALETGADGIHVGQQDLPCREVVRRARPGMIVGVSARTPERARAAAADGADYIGAGAVFPTGTKPDAPVIGLAGLEAVVAAVSIPVVAVGGIGAGNLKTVLATGVRYCAVVSEINAAPDPAAAFRRLSAEAAAFPGEEERRR
jgi:thiamine-phosphate pyrophosphorylase